MFCLKPNNCILQDHAAFPLFVLYRAISLQTDKGPVDIVNGKAYYSLSEHSVLQLDNIEYNTMVNENIRYNHPVIIFACYYLLYQICSKFSLTASICITRAHDLMRGAITQKHILGIISN